MMDGRGVEPRLSKRSGVVHVQANALNQTATIHYDPDVTGQNELQAWIEECGFHCSGRSVPGHVCDPQDEPARPAHEGHAMPTISEARGTRAAAAHTGHGGHAGMSTADISSLLVAFNALLLKRAKVPWGEREKESTWHR